MNYKSLNKRFENQSARDIFAHFLYNGQSGENWEYPFKRLAFMARGEDWSFHRNEFINQYPNQSYPILTNYLNYTF